MKKSFSSAFKKQVVLEAIKEEKTMAQISAEYKVLPARIYTWKKLFLDNCEKVFNDQQSQGNKAILQQKELEISKLEQKIGQLVIENDFYKKKLPL